MNTTVTRLAVAFGAALAIACGGRDQAENDAYPPAVVTPGEAAGMSGASDQLITVSGCVVKMHDGYMLASLDETIIREETGTAGHRRDDTRSEPDEANRGAEDERLRHAQNPSAELGRYRLEGDAERLAMLVSREVEVRGRVQAGDAANDTPAVLRVETIDATGPRCTE